MYILCDAFVDMEAYNRACDELEATANDKRDDDGHYYEDD